MISNPTSHDALALLDRLVATPSISGDEADTAELLTEYLRSHGVEPNRLHNNVWAVAEGYDPVKPTLLLNSHHDTVRPAVGYTRDPFTPHHIDGRIYGLGSNDAGGSVVTLATLFLRNRDTSHLPFNLILALTAEEETMGANGMRAMLEEFAARGLKITMALVGEPTDMQPAIGERGLVVLNGTAHGRSGHAAREEGENAMYKALDDIAILRQYRFERTSEVLGDIKISVTQIEAGSQHNIVPAECRFVVDVRTTDAYSNEEVVALLQQAVGSELVPRSTRIRASAISTSHPLVEAAVESGGECFISPTTSDRALMGGIAALKMGVGCSARSHTADEYVEEREIIDGLERYESLLASLARILNR